MKNLDDILRLITGNMNHEEKRNAYSTIKDDPDSADLYKKAKITWALMSSTRNMPDYKVEESYQALQTRIKVKRNVLKLDSYFKYAAVLILVSSISTLTFYLGKQNSSSLGSEIKYTSVVADRGQISKIVLPDSSVVWLNSGTTLTYNNDYSYKNRNLNLSGQAFLQVKKNKNLPLIITSGDLRVKVLGTRFDVCAYPDENSIRVFLESGKVELLNTSDNSFKYNLIPGEMAKYDSKSGKINIYEASKGDYFTWKDGEMKFVDTPMEEVIRLLERKFDVEIKVENPNIYKSVFNANFTTESLKEILDYIQYTCPINYQIEKQKETDKSKVILSNKNSSSNKNNMPMTK